VSEVRGVHPAIPGEIRNLPIGELAERQHGVVAVRQLPALGVRGAEIETRIARGDLVRLHRGVYAVGHRQLRPQGFWLAAVLAAGPGAVLSHRSAAALHAIGPRPTRIEITTPTEARPEGIAVYTRRRLDADEVTTVDGIPVTTVARTLLDLAGTLTPDRLAKALNEAELQRVFDGTAIEAALAKAATRKGAGELRKALAQLADHGPALTRSELEDRFFALLDRHDLPRPRTNAWIGTTEVDALWPEHGLVVELDGYAAHHSKAAFQRDRTKANALTRIGYRVLRYTYADVVSRAAETAATLRAFLAP